MFAFSTLSAHTGELAADSRCSLTVTAEGFKGAADARVTLVGKTVKLPEEEWYATRDPKP